MKTDWMEFFSPILKALADGLIKIIYELVEQWAESALDKSGHVSRNSIAKKQKAMVLAREFYAGDLSENQISAAIEMVHQAKKHDGSLEASRLSVEEHEPRTSA